VIQRSLFTTGETLAGAGDVRKKIMRGAKHMFRATTVYLGSSVQVSGYAAASIRTVVSNEVPHASHCHTWRTRHPSTHSDHSGM
jgi:hypothetical protein